ncbi:hypothetical protein [Saccharopolyspora shandongensis]|uniref:hypothetical protein n=1 Tax=Saccharopolyspora shandongensis TaxID=418495 RepID=UPI0033FC1CE6
MLRVIEHVPVAKKLTAVYERNSRANAVLAFDDPRKFNALRVELKTSSVAAEAG